MLQAAGTSSLSRLHAAAIHWVPAVPTADGLMSEADAARPPGRAGRPGKPARRAAHGEPQRTQDTGVPGEPACTRPGAFGGLKLTGSESERFEANILESAMASGTDGTADPGEHPIGHSCKHSCGARQGGHQATRALLRELSRVAPEPRDTSQCHRDQHHRSGGYGRACYGQPRHRPPRPIWRSARFELPAAYSIRHCPCSPKRNCWPAGSMPTHHVRRRVTGPPEAATPSRPAFRKSANRTQTELNPYAPDLLIYGRFVRAL
jgi:hypothetical protein